jgi:Mg-chelatase subunit ChlD
MNSHEYYESLIEQTFPFGSTEIAKKNALELRKQRLSRFAQVFGRVNSVLTLRPISVSVATEDIPSPAWSTSRSVVFNSNEIGELDNAQTIASVKGLNLHEVGHILYTPRNGTEFVQWIKDNDYWQAFNALEDCRIETLLVGRYPSVVNWFTATIVEFLMKTPQAMSVAYPLVAGRRYLPLQVRQLARALYVKQSDVDELSAITNQYRQVAFPADIELAKELVVRFHNLVTDLQQHGEGSDLSEGDPNSHADRPAQGIDSSTSRPASVKQQRNDIARSKQLDKGDDSKAPSNDQIKQAIERAKQQSQNKSQQSQNEQSGDDSDFDDDGNDPVASNTPSTQSQDSSSDNNGDQAGDQPADDPVETILNSVLQEVLNDSDVANEINDLLRQLNGLPSLQTNSSQKPEQAKYENKSVDSDTVQSARSFGRELERLRADSDPAWDKKLSSGKLNAKRAMRGDSFDSVFDQWNMGRADATEIECVVLLDTSGSMSGINAEVAYKSMYAIKHALDRISANTTVLTFANQAKLLYDKTEKAGVTIRDSGSGGGTEPLSAIKYATKLFAETDKSVKVLFVITDGAWQYGYGADNEITADKEIEKLRRSGVLTALAYIDDNVSVEVNPHNCELAKHINNPNQLVDLARKLVKLAIMRRLTNA